jgi:hypothetical protein
LVTARQAAEEEGVTRKRLGTKQCQGSVSYGVGSQAIYRKPCSSRMLSRWRHRDIENGDRDRSRMGSTEVLVEELRYSVVIIG